MSADGRSTAQLTEAVRRIWCAVLDTEIVDLDQSFFDAGGHSLLLLVLQEHVSELVRSEVAIEDLFDHPTVRAQATLLARLGASAEPDAEATASTMAPASTMDDPGAGRRRLLGRQSAVASEDHAPEDAS